MKKAAKITAIKSIRITITEFDDGTSNLQRDTNNMTAFEYLGVLDYENMHTKVGINKSMKSVTKKKH